MAGRRGGDELGRPSVACRGLSLLCLASFTILPHLKAHSASYLQLLPFLAFPIPSESGLKHSVLDILRLIVADGIPPPKQALHVQGGKTHLLPTRN